MAEVSVEVGGRHYPVTCRDGDESHVLEIARLVDAKAQDAMRSVGGMNEARHLLIAALLLADELNDLRDGKAPAAASPALDLAPALERLAERAEGLAARLEKNGATP